MKQMTLQDVYRFARVKGVSLKKALAALKGEGRTRNDRPRKPEPNGRAALVARQKKARPQ